MSLPFAHMEFGMEDEQVQYNEEHDEENYYTPIWMCQPRGFVDFGLLQENEVLALIESNLPSDVLNWDFTDKEEWHFRYPEVDIRFKTSSASSSFLLPIEVLNSNYVLERTFIDPLRVSLRAMAAHEGSRLTCFYEFALLVLRILEETSSSLLEWRSDGTAPPQKDWSKGWIPHEVKSWADVVDNPVGVDLTSVTDTAHYILGKTPEQICANIPSNFRILHIESVLRNDLTERFFTCRAKMRQLLRERPQSELARNIPHERGREKMEHEDMVDYLTTPKLTFHGTRRNNVASIVRYGFVKPGKVIGDTGVQVSVACGNTYGRGIYSSPSPQFSLSYSGYNATATTASEIPSMKLIVCGTLMGRTALIKIQDQWRNMDDPMLGAESHVANQGFEYIVYREAQIIPCYVIHIDWGAEMARNMLENIPLNPSSWIARHKNKPHPKLMQEVLYAGDIEREKAAKKAAALKWFPYGFGAAQGTSFVIEEIAEVSDDDENYGEYQNAKVAEATRRRDAHAAHAKKNYELNMGKTSIFDEFWEAAHLQMQQKINPR